MASILCASGIAGSSVALKCSLSRKTVSQARLAMPAPSVCRLSSAPQVAAAFSPVSQRVSRRAASLKVSASKDPDIDLEEGVTGRGDYTHLLALLGLVGVFYSQYSVSAEMLLKALAGLQLFTAAAHLVTRRGVFDHVTQVVGPSVLAASVLSLKHVSYLDMATGLFGYSLAEKLEGPSYLWLGTLLAALYFGYGTQWYVAAFGLLAANRIYRSLNDTDGKRVPLLLAPVVASAGWALYKEATVTFSLVIYLAHTVWSGLTTLQALAKTAEEST